MAMFNQLQRLPNSQDLYQETRSSKVGIKNKDTVGEQQLPGYILFGNHEAKRLAKIVL